MHLFILLLASLAAPAAASTGARKFTLSNGDTVMCVPLADQLSLAGSVHNDVQLKPSARYRSSQRFPQQQSLQLFEEEARSCNEGAIPVLVGQKPVMKSKDAFPSGAMTHEFSTAHLSGNFSGMQTTFNVWKPFVEKSYELSLSQVWVASRKQGKLNTIEAGWQVKGSGQDPRLFIFWTADEYDKTGCFNLDCKGFVQVSNKFVLGGTFSKVSLVGSTQYEHTFRVFQDHVTSNWWLRINNVDVGYWPSSLFNSLKHGSELMVMGGKVSYEKRDGQRHTKTQMGSGMFPEKGLKQAAYHRGIQYLDQSGKPQSALGISYITRTPGCYHSKPAMSKEWGAAFFYGGPGFNTHCQ